MQLSRPSYSEPRSAGLFLIPEGWPAPDLAQLVHGQLRGLVTSPAFPCLGARSSFAQASYRFAMYGELTEPASTEALSRHLLTYLEEIRSLRAEFSTFVAAFAGPAPVDDKHFHLLVWKQLQDVHDYDTCRWDPSRATDPEDSVIPFSYEGAEFLVIGLHPAASRRARRFSWPVLIFNIRSQFERLRLQGHMDRFRTTIRRRDEILEAR